MKLYEIAVKHGANSVSEKLFIVAGSDESALDIAREEMRGKGNGLTIAAAAEAIDGVAPRLIARRPSSP